MFTFRPSLTEVQIFQLTATVAALAVWAFGALARWRFDDTAERIVASEDNVEAAILAMGNRIALEMGTLDDTYRGKINQIYFETQSKLDAMDELLRSRLTTASTTTTTINTIFNRFGDDGDGGGGGGESERLEGQESPPVNILVRPLLENEDADLVANRPKHENQKRYDPKRVLNAWRRNWALLPDGVVGLSERDKLDLNYDELYGKQDLKDLADDVSWFPQEDLDKTGVVGHFEDAGEVVYRLYESDLEEDFYYSDGDYGEESDDDKDVAVGGSEEEQEGHEKDKVQKEGAGGGDGQRAQDHLQVWRERFSGGGDRLSGSERPRPEKAPESESAELIDLGENSEPEPIHAEPEPMPNPNPTILALMKFIEGE